LLAATSTFNSFEDETKAMVSVLQGVNPFNSFEDETFVIHDVIRNRLAYLSIPLRMKHEWGNDYQGKLQKYAFNSFEDETIFTRLYLFLTHTFLSIPLRMKRGSP